MKRWLSNTAAALLLSLLLATPVAADFVDVPQDHPNTLAIEYLTTLEILQGQGNGISFAPRLLVNRAEWAMILLRIEQAELEEGEYQNCFPDVRDEWFAGAVCFAAEMEWIKGYQAGPEAGRFIPTNPINLAELLVMLERFFGWDTREGEFWYSAARNYAITANLVDAEVPFDHQLSRAEAAEILFRTLVVEEYLVDQYDPLLGESALREIGGDVSSGGDAPLIGPVIPVTLRAFPDQPENTNVLSGSTYVPVLRFWLESSQAVTISELSVRKRAASLTRDLLTSRLMVNGKVIREGSFSSNEPYVTWRSLNQRISPGNPLLVEVNVDFRQAPPEEFIFQSFQFEVSPADIVLKESGARVQGDPVLGILFDTSPLIASTVTVTNPESAVRLPRIAEDDEVIGRFSIRAGERDIAIRRIRLEDAEDVNRQHFRNFRLLAGSEEVAFIEDITNNVLDFQLNDHLIEAEKDESFRVVADIGEASPSDRIRIYLEEGDDLHAVELEFGFGARVDNQFGRGQAWCVGAESVQCNSENLQRRCSREERDAGLRGCENEDSNTPEEDPIPESCDDRIAPVCGTLNEQRQTFDNRCKAQMAQASDIQTGPCP